MKKALLAILWLILSLMLPACATNDGPSKYERLEAEAKISGDNSKLESYDRQAERAGQWFEHKIECMGAEGNVWFCSNGAAATNKRNKPMTTEKLIRDYNKERWANCGCTTSGEMRDAMRRISRY